MKKLIDYTKILRSKNAGPLFITFDLIFHNNGDMCYELGPFIVDIDTKGRNLFDQLDEKISENKDKALRELGIDPDFQFTKLY